MTVMKSAARADAAAALATLGVVGLAAEPAAAAQVSTYYQGVSAAFDNNPGNGAESWLWLHNGSRPRVARVHYLFYGDNESSPRKFDIWSPTTSASMNFDRDIWKIRACSWAEYGAYPVCGPWT
jgi:hypothetical protein